MTSSFNVLDVSAIKKSKSTYIQRFIILALLYTSYHDVVRI